MTTITNNTFYSKNEQDKVSGKQVLPRASVAALTLTHKFSKTPTSSITQTPSATTDTQPSSGKLTCPSKIKLNGAPIVVNNQTIYSGGGRGFNAAILANRDIIVAWQHQVLNATTGVVDDTIIYGTKFDSNYQPIGNNFILLNAAFRSIISLKNGGFVIVYSSSSSDLKAQIFDDNKNKIGSEIVIVSDTDVSASDSVMIELSDGNLLAVVEERGGPNFKLSGQIYNSTGVLIREKFTIDSTYPNHTGTTAAVTKAGLLVAWFSWFSNENRGNVAQLLNQNGTETILEKKLGDSVVTLTSQGVIVPTFKFTPPEAANALPNANQTVELDVYVGFYPDLTSNFSTNLLHLIHYHDFSFARLYRGPSNSFADGSFQTSWSVGQDVRVSPYRDRSDITGCYIYSSKSNSTTRFDGPCPNQLFTTSDTESFGLTQKNGVFGLSSVVFDIILLKLVSETERCSITVDKPGEYFATQYVDTIWIKANGVKLDLCDAKNITINTYHNDLEVTCPENIFSGHLLGCDSNITE